MIMQGSEKITYPENAVSYRTTIGANSPKRYRALSQSMLDDLMRLRENAQRVLWDAEPTTRRATPSKVDRQLSRAQLNPRHSSSSDSESSSGSSSSSSTSSESSTLSSAPSYGSSVETSRPSHARAFDFAHCRNTSAVNTPDELSDFEDNDLRLPRSNVTPLKRQSSGSGNASRLGARAHVPSPRWGYIGLNETHKRVEASPLPLGRHRHHYRQREWLLSPRKDDEVVVGHVGIGIGKSTLNSLNTLSKGVAARHVDVMAGDLVRVASRVDPRASTNVWLNSTKNAHEATQSPSHEPRIVLIREPATHLRMNSDTATAATISSIHTGTAAGDFSGSDSATKATPRYDGAIALPNAVGRDHHHQNNRTIISRITGTGLTLISPPWSDNNRSVGINTTSSRPQSSSSSSSPPEPSTSAAGVPQPHTAVDTNPSIGTTLTSQILGKAQQTLASIEAKQLLERLTGLLRTTQTRQEEERRALNAARHLTQGEQRHSSFAWSTPAVTLLREQQKELATITKQIAEVKRVLVEVDRHAVEVKHAMLDASVMSRSSLGTQTSQGRHAKRKKRDSEAADALRQAEEERRKVRERQNKHAHKVKSSKRLAEAKRVKWEARRDAALAEAEQISRRLKEEQRTAYLERKSQRVKKRSEAKTSNRPTRLTPYASTKYVDVESGTSSGGEGSYSSQNSDLDIGADEMLDDPNINTAIIFSRIFSERVEDVSTPDLLSEASHDAPSSSPSRLSREGSSAPSRSPSEERVGWRKLEENGVSSTKAVGSMASGIAREDANAARWLHEPQLYPSCFINRLLRRKKEPTLPLNLPDEQPTQTDDERAPVQSGKPDGLLITPLRVSNSPGPRRPSAAGLSEEASPYESNTPRLPRVEGAKTVVASSNSAIAVPSSTIYVTSTEESFIEKREGTSQTSTVVTRHYRLQKDGGGKLDHIDNKHKILSSNPNHNVVLHDDESEELFRQGAYEVVDPDEEEEDQSSLLVIRESLSGRNSQPGFHGEVVQSEQTRERSPFPAHKDSTLGLDKVVLVASQFSLLREDPIRFRGDSTPLSEAWLCVTGASQRRHESTKVPVRAENEEVRLCDYEWEEETTPPPRDRQLVEAQPLLLVSSEHQTQERSPSEFDNRVVQTRDKTVQTVCDAASSPSLKPDENQGASTQNTSLLTTSKPPLAASSPSVSQPLKPASRAPSVSRSLSAQSRARSMSFSKDHSKRIEGDLVCERCYRHRKGAGGCSPTKGSSRSASARNSFHFRDEAYQTPAGKATREKRRRSQSAQQIEPNNMAGPEEGAFVIPALSEIRSIATKEDGLTETVRALQKEGKVAVITRCGFVSSSVTPPREPEKGHESRTTSVALTTPTFASMAQCSPRGLAMLAMGDHPHTEAGGRPNASPSRITLFVRDTLTNATDSSSHPLRNSPSRSQNWNNRQPWSPIRSVSARNIGPPSNDSARRLSTPPRASDDIASESDDEVRSRTEIPLPTPRMRARSVSRRDRPKEATYASLTSPSKLTGAVSPRRPLAMFERATAGELKGIRERSAERVKTALSVKRENRDEQLSHPSSLAFTSLRDDDGSDFDTVSELTVSARTSRAASVQPSSDLPLPQLPIDLLNAVCEF